ncbi:MAG: general secretion pathway protein GspB [Salinisphaeraceae bacterium]
MSYLLDALRKAERERRLGEVPDLGTETADGTASRGNGLPVWVFWLIGIVVAVNLGGMAAMWWMWSADPSASSLAADEMAAMPASPADFAVTADPVERVTPPPAEPVVRATPEPAPVPEPAEPATRSLGSADDIVPTRRALPAAQQQRLPDLDMNGLLYSSIPGRSFVLINGRRYHQGERTAAGPAVESIDEGGAILNHQGLRFRLPAPQ